MSVDELLVPTRAILRNYENEGYTAVTVERFNEYIRTRMVSSGRSLHVYADEVPNAEQIVNTIIHLFSLSVQFIAGFYSQQTVVAGSMNIGIGSNVGIGYTGFVATVSDRVEYNMGFYRGDEPIILDGRSHPQSYASINPRPRFEAMSIPKKEKVKKIINKFQWINNV